MELHPIESSTTNPAFDCDVAARGALDTARETGLCAYCDAPIAEGAQAFCSTQHMRKFHKRLGAQRRAARDRVDPRQWEIERERDRLAREHRAYDPCAERDGLDLVKLANSDRAVLALAALVELD